MSVFRYPTYKIRIAPDSQKTQGLQAGDIIRRQYAERERTVYSLMCVTETGTELVGDKDAPYFIGALLDGDEPQGGELLDFVRITNLFDTARSGALYLTASDSDSPYMDVIDGMATERSLCYPVMDGGMAGASIICPSGNFVKRNAESNPQKALSFRRPCPPDRIISVGVRLE